MDAASVDRYRTIRSQIEHEDNLVSQRLSWFLGSQSFLFTAYAISLNGPTSFRSHELNLKDDLLMILIPLVSICSAFLIWLSILAGLNAMRRLRRMLEGEAPPAGLPPVQGDRFGRLLGLCGPSLLPPLFMAVWLVMVLK